MSRMRTVRLVVALQEKNCTNAELQEASGYSRDSVGLLLNSLRDEGFADTMGWGDRDGNRGAAPVLWGWRK